MDVSTDADTEFENGACSDVREGTHVEVEGELRLDGRWVAAEVELGLGSGNEDEDDDNDDDDDGKDDDRRAPPA